MVLQPSSFFGHTCHSTSSAARRVRHSTESPSLVVYRLRTNISPQFSPSRAPGDGEPGFSPICVFPSLTAIERLLLSSAMSSTARSRFAKGIFQTHFTVGLVLAVWHRASFSSSMTLTARTSFAMIIFQTHFSLRTAFAVYHRAFVSSSMMPAARSRFAEFIFQARSS